MRRIVSVSAVVLLFGLTPVVGMAAAVVQRPFVTPNPSITFVDGWWEQEHHDQDAPQRYSRLPPQQFNRYNQLQAETNRRDEQRRQMDADNSRAQQEQHRLLGFDVIVR
jgi:hypothetical protein